MSYSDGFPQENQPLAQILNLEIDSEYSYIMYLCCSSTWSELLSASLTKSFL